MNLTERYQEKLHGKCSVLEPGHDSILLQMGVANDCNHRCCFCPNASSHRKKTMMDYGFATRIIKVCAPFLGEHKQLCFHMNGDPLLYPRLPDLIRLSKQLGYSYIFLTTNGAVSTDDTLKRLLDVGLDSIKFSISHNHRLSRNLIKISTPTQPPSGKNPGGGLTNTRSKREGMTKARSILREKRI